MVIYILLLLFVLAGGCFSGYLPEGQRKRFDRIYLFISWGIVILLAAFRSNEVGADTPAYVYDYTKLPNFSFEDLTIRHEGYLGYYYISKCFSLCGVPLWAWFGFVEAIYCCSIYRLSKLFSKDQYMSLFVFITIGLFSFSLAGLKQTLSASFIMLSFLWFIKRRYIISGALAILTYFTHPVCLVFLAVFPIYLFRNKSFFVWVVMGICIFTIYTGQLVLVKMVDTIGISHFEAYLEIDNSYTYTTLIIYVMLTVMGSVSWLPFLRRRPAIFKICISSILLACAFQSLSSISPSIFRLALLFVPFYMFYISNLCYYDGSRGGLLRVCYIICLSFTFLYTTGMDMPYSFR